MKILFLCVANSARSQLAEGLAKEILGPAFEIESAGSVPSGYVNPYAIKALKDRGIDISQNRSKAISDLSPKFIEDLDFVVTLCEEEVCPILPTKAKKLHWGLPDPAAVSGNERDIKTAFNETRDEIGKLLKALSSASDFNFKGAGNASDIRISPASE